MSKNYATLIEKFKILDDNNDGCVDRPHFTSILKELNMRTDGDYVDVVFRGTKIRGQNLVHFNDFRALYEAQSEGYYNKTMGIIFFKGVDFDRDCYITKKEFSMVRKLYVPPLDENTLQTVNKQLEESGNKLSYRDFMKIIYDVTVTPDEDPHKLKMEVRSPHTSFCLLL